MKRKIFAITIAFVLVLAIFSIVIDYNADEGGRGYFGNLELMVTSAKKKFTDFMIIKFTQADFIRIQEDKLPEDRMLEQLEDTDNQEIYYPGCGGGEAILD